MNVTFRNFQRIHLVGIGGSGMSGIAEVLLSSGYARFRLRFEILACHRAAAETGRDNSRRAQGRKCAWRARGGHFFRRARGQCRSCRSASAENSRDSARGNARRTDAAEIWHRCGGRARQDHHDFDGGRGAGRSGSRPHVCRWRPREPRGPNAAWARANTWWSKRTKATARFCCSRR